MSVDTSYAAILQSVRTWGKVRPNRTGVNTIAISSAMFQHDMSEGFPILGRKKISFKTSKVELIGFLLGITKKSWYQSRGCTIWDEWCNPAKIPISLSKHFNPNVTQEEIKAFMKKEDDLGPIYGSQWRNFDNQLQELDGGINHAADQIGNLLLDLETAPDSRRMIVSAWNPMNLSTMALPPCHFSFQVLVIGDELHLNWNQRSVDLFLGLPYNICFYGLLLECLAHQFQLKPGMLTGFLGDTHIYENHFDQVEEYLSRHDPDEKPHLVFPKCLPSEFSILDDNRMMQVRLANYHPHPAIKADVAI